MRLSTPTRQSRFPRVSFWLLLILAASLVLNLWGVGYGLPDRLYPDEGRIINIALAFGMGDLNPHYFNYPALTMYLLFFIYAAYFLVGRMMGIFSSAADFQRLFFTDPSSFYLLGRIWVAVTGTAVVAMVYRVAASAYRENKAGLIAALIFAPLPYFVYYSHFVVTDILLLFFILLAYLFIIGIYRTGELRYYLLAAAAIGLGAAVKYSPGMLVVTLVLAHLFRELDSGRRVWRLSFLRLPVLAGAVSVLFFFIGSPYCFLDYQGFLASLELREHIGRWHIFGTGEGSAWLDYPRLLFFHSFSMLNRFDPMGVILAGGLVWALRHRTKIDLLFLSFPLMLYLLMGRWTSGSIRYALPIIVVLALLAGRAIVEAFSAISRLKSEPVRRLARGSLSGVLVLSVSLSLLNTGLINFRLTRPDTRTLAREWIEDNIAPGTALAVEWDTEATVQLWESPEDIASKIEAYETGAASTIHHSSAEMAAVHRMRLEAVPEASYRIIRLGGMDGVTVLDDNYSLEELRARGVEYLVTSADVSRIFASPRGREVYPEQAAFYDRVERELIPAREFLPNPLSGPGPAIRIYRLD